MEHNICRDNLSAYLDGELSGEEKLSLESHLALCPTCSRTLAELKQVSAVFKKHVMQPEPLSLKEAVFAEKPAGTFFSSWLKPAAAFAAAAACLLIIFGLPKIPEREQAASSELLANAYKEERASLEDLAGSSAGAEDVSALSAPSAAGLGGGSLRSAAPAANRGAFGQTASATRGSFGQAKFAGRALSRAERATSPFAVSLAGGSGASASFARGNVKAKRAAPAVVPDIVADGVRYAAAHWREGSGEPRNGGSVRAFSARGGELLWEARVYEAAEDPGLEADVQQVHISALALNGKKLEIADERGYRYLLDISTRKVETLPR